MKTFLISITIVLIGSLMSCDSTPKGTKDEKKISVNQDGLIMPLNIKKGGDYKSLEEIRNQTRALIDHRVEESPEAYSMVTHGYWEPEFVFNAGKMSKENQYLGYWINFEDDFTYSYGLFDKIQGGGRYHFRLEDNTLLMLDNDEEIEPKVWTAQNNGDAMALVGRHDFGINNGMQIKMIPNDERPKK